MQKICECSQIYLCSHRSFLHLFKWRKEMSRILKSRKQISIWAYHSTCCFEFGCWDSVSVQPECFSLLVELILYRKHSWNKHWRSHCVCLTGDSFWKYWLFNKGFVFINSQQFVYLFTYLFWWLRSIFLGFEQRC